MKDGINKQLFVQIPVNQKRYLSTDVYLENIICISRVKKVIPGHIDKHIFVMASATNFGKPLAMFLVLSTVQYENLILFLYVKFII